VNVKLQAMLNAARYVEAAHGAPSLKRVFAACRPDTRVRLETGIAIEWLPVEQLIEFYEALVRIVADGDRDILRRERRAIERAGVIHIALAHDEGAQHRKPIWPFA
jgi:hypothetical protein